ncbi:MAG: Tat pathway signal sequence domain protein, partial [Armatimonadota bacterium]
TSDRLRLNDPLVPLWKETLAKLTPYPVDAETGYMVGRGVPFVKSHRHFSHLMMVYPLHMVDPGSPQDRPLIEKSLGHWMGLGNAHRGYSFTGASAMSSWLNRPEDSVRYLNSFLDR